METNSLAYHFRGARSAMRSLFDQLITTLARELPPFELKVGKSYIGLVHRLVFGAIHVRTQRLVVEFVPRREFVSPRIVRSVKFQQARWAQYVPVTTPTEIDTDLIG